MPSNWLYVDTNFPSFTGKETVNEKIETIQSYLYVLLENLRYSLHNLDTTNMNQFELNKYVNGITDPVYKRLEDDEGNITQLQVTAQGLAMEINNAKGDINKLQITAQGMAAEISNAKGDINKLQITAQGMAAEISNAKGDITKLQATAQGLAADISNAKGDITQLRADATGLASRVSNAEGSISAFQQTVDGFTFAVSDNGNNSTHLVLSSQGVELASTDIQIKGMVTFSDLQGNGSTVINGDYITTGTVLSKYIKLMGKLTVYDDNGYLGGYLGYMEGLAKPDPNAPAVPTYGIGFEGLTGGQCLATTAGVRMTKGNASVVVIDGAVELRAGSTCLRVWENGQVTINNVPLSV